jgi:hypothetical protein
MAERKEHQRVLATLAALDRDLFSNASCWFAGGTAIALRCGEFRVSEDVDFLCASRDGYRLLRERVFDHGIAALFRAPPAVLRQVRADRYGIRTVLDIDGEPMKFEIVSEGRIELHGVADPSLPVPRLADEDLVAEKLLANADRYLDDAALARDAIDLIVLEHTLGGLPPAAFAKARQAYGASVDEAWHRALERLRDKPELLARSLDAMAVDAPTRALISARLARVATR